MIGKIIYDKGRNYICDDCKNVVVQFRSYAQARASGWAISYDRKSCYCPTCAPFRRNVGKSGNRRKTLQINIDNSTES